MPSRPYAQYTRPEQSNPLAGEVPPHRYGTPTALSATLAARSPRVGLGFGFGVGFQRELHPSAWRRRRRPLDAGGRLAVCPGGRAAEDDRDNGQRKQSSAEGVRHSGEGNDGPLRTRGCSPGLLVGP